MAIRTLLLKPPIFNVGDGFVAKGAKSLLNSLPVDIEVIESSAFSYRIARWAGGHSDDFLEQTTGIGELVDVDLAILPGCTLFRGAMLEHSKIFKQLSSQDIPIILLGTGGFDYSSEEKSTVRSYLTELGVDAIITRNDEAYEAYCDSVEHAYKGIDCAFFIDEWCNPPEADKEYIAVTFLSSPEPEIDSNLEVVRPHHEPFLLLPQTELLEFSYHSSAVDTLTSIYEQIEKSPLEVKDKLPVLNQLPANFPARNLKKSVLQEFREGDVFMSGELSEYLFIYSNASKVYTERVHATIPSLVFGTPVKFCLDTPRSGLFQDMVEEDSGFWSLDAEKFKQKKQEQRENISNSITELVE